MIIIIVCFKIKSLKSLKFKVEPVQKGELINGKMFVTKDLYQLKVHQKISQTSDALILGVHDFKMNKTEFLNLANYLEVNTDFSYFFYDQRGVGENKPFNPATQASLISDLDEILTALQEKFNKKIILVASGRSAAAALLFSQDERINKIIIPNITLNEPYKVRTSKRMQIFFNYLLLVNSPLLDDFYGEDFTSDLHIAKELDKLHLDFATYSFREYWQNQCMQRKMVQNINQARVQVACYLSNNDFFCGQKQATKFLNKLKNPNFKAIPITDQKHYWLWENNLKNFNKFIDNC